MALIHRPQVSFTSTEQRMIRGYGLALVTAAAVLVLPFVWAISVAISALVVWNLYGAWSTWQALRGRGLWERTLDYGAQVLLILCATLLR